MLASRADVAAALGLDNAEALSASQQARVDGLLERVSGVVAREANRDFTPGEVMVRLLVIDGRVHLPDADTEQDITVTDAESNPVDSETDAPGWIRVARNGTPIVTGQPLMVTYTRQEVPGAVAQLVAGVVARHLTVEPGSPESQATDITAGAEYRWRGAEWVSSTALFTADELSEVRSYRSHIPNVVIHRL